MPETAERTRETPIPGRPYSARMVRRLRVKLRSRFRDQYAEAMDLLDRAAGRKAIGIPEPDWRSMFTPAKLEAWKDDVYPDLKAGFKMGGKAGIADIREQLEEQDVTIQFSAWSVEAPGARFAIKKAAMDLSADANDVTQRQLNGIIPRLRAELIQGTAQGESYDWMANRIKDLFGHADKYRSQRIAITETQRAIHKGLLEQYQESGVVEAKQWLTSGAPCPLCEAIALENEQGIALAAEFARVGKNPTYSSVQSPPAHPGCLCSLYPILIPIERMPRAAA